MRRRSSSSPTARRWRCCAPRSVIARNWPAACSTRSSHRRGGTPRSRSFGHADGPSLLVSTESGGEGRNFEFCRRLVLFDLPWKPSTVEQRIGRLDRIGRRIPVEIVYFSPPSGLGSDVVRLFEELGLFRRTVGRTRAATGARGERTRRDRARSARRRLSEERLETLVGVAQAARTRIRRGGVPAAPPRSLPRRRWLRHLLARVPAELDALNEQSRRDGLRSTRVHRRAHARPPNVLDRAGERGAGRQPARCARADRASSARSIAKRLSRTRRSTSSHPGTRSSRGSSLTSRTARSAVSCDSRSKSARDRGSGTRRHLQGRPAVRGRRARLRSGRDRPDWAAAFRQRPLRARRMGRCAIDDPKWPEMIRRLGARLEPARRPYALAAIVVRPARVATVP